jgi:Ca-activated chloride channel homolog
VVEAPGMTRFGRITLVVSAALCLAWMNPTRDQIEDGNQLFKQGKYDAALSKYGNVLVNDPDSPLLNFNMGDANYKAGKYTEAINSFARVRPGDNDPKQLAKVAYNVGNAQYRLAAAAEADKPQDALQGYATALAAYRRALGADPTDRDAKFNYEFVSKKLDDLKKKLEEQKQQQDQQKDQQQQQQDQQQQQQDQQQSDQQQEQKDQQDQQQQQAQQDQKGEQQEQEKQQEQQHAAQEAGEKQDEEQQGAAQAAGGASSDKKDQMSQQEAAAVIDTAKNDELQPDEFARQAQGGRVAEPAQDW